MEFFQTMLGAESALRFVGGEYRPGTHTTQTIAASLAIMLSLAVGSARQQPVTKARVIVQTDVPGCSVDIDAATVGATSASGTLSLASVDPGDHYIHVRCPGKPEAAYFASAQTTRELRIDPHTSALPTANTDPIAMASNKARLQELVQNAIQLRAQAKLDEAVAALHQAMALDPENVDLHRELGITFLLAKEWKRARIEMLEAIRQDRTDADAHNGLGYALEKLGDLPGALKEYHLATQLEPDDPSYRTHYFEALARTQEEKINQK